jgi:hypothetical protein
MLKEVPEMDRPRRLADLSPLTASKARLIDNLKKVLVTGTKDEVEVAILELDTLIAYEVHLLTLASVRAELDS